jgi:hypothetical protein
MMNHARLQDDVPDSTPGSASQGTAGTQIARHERSTVVHSSFPHRPRSLLYSDSGLQCGDNTLIRPNPSRQEFGPAYRFGDSIPASGIYRAIHEDHRLAHEVTLAAGDLFPRCKKCADQVQFVLLQESPAALHDRDFRIRLYEIPHPEEGETVLESTA